GRGKPGLTAACQVGGRVGRAGRKRARGRPELTARRAARGASASGASPGREARRVDELDGHVTGQELAAAKADPAAAGKSGAVEVVKARVEDGTAADG